LISANLAPFDCCGMSLLGSLPPELLLHCCSFLDAASLFKLCLVSRSIHPYAEQILYRVFPAETETGWGSFWKFLYTILRRPDLAQHVRKVTLPYSAFRAHGRRSAPPGVQTLPKYKKNGQPNLITIDPSTRWFVIGDEILRIDVGREDLALLIRSADQLGLTKKKSWLQYMAWGYPEPYTFVLVYNLPNLEVIHTHLPLSPRFYWNFYYGDTADGSPPSLRFKRLREFSVLSTRANICELSYTEVKQILSLPHITRLDAIFGKPPFYGGVTLYDPLAEPSYFGHIEERSSNLSHLSLENVDHQQVMVTLVRAARALKSFRYQYPALQRLEYIQAPSFNSNALTAPEGYGFSPRVLGRTLQAHVDSLEELHVTMDRRPPSFGSPPEGVDESRGFSMAQIDLNSRFDTSQPKFKRLKHLIIDIGFLLGVDRDKQCLSGSVALEEMARCVPNSVDTLELHSTCEEPGLQALLAAVSMEMPSRRGIFKHVVRFSTTARLVTLERVLRDEEYEICAQALDPVRLSKVFFCQIHCTLTRGGWMEFHGQTNPAMSPGDLLQHNIRTVLYGESQDVHKRFNVKNIPMASELSFRFALCFRNS
jgi:hypothetical protein